MSPEFQRHKRMMFGAGVVTIALLTGLAVTFGRQLSDDVVAFERWIADQGVWAPVVFAGALILLTSLFVPDSLLAAAAGALFGISTGLLVTLVGVLAAQCIAFTLSRYFLRARVRRALSKRPQLSAIERAAGREGLRLQWLLRLAPLNPVAVSHVIGVTQVGFWTFLLGCIGLIPGLFVEVYCGYMAKHLLKVSGHVSEHSRLQTVMMVFGLAVCAILLFYVTRLARRAIDEPVAVE